MARVLVTLLVLIVPAFSLAQESPASELKPFQWKNRVLIVDESENPAPVIDQIKRAEREIRERDIVWFVLNNDAVFTNYSGRLPASFAAEVRKVYLAEGNRSVALVGKDGLLQSTFPALNLGIIFARIDTMPSGREEVQE